MQVWNVLHTAHWKYSTQQRRKNSPSAHHRTTSWSYQAMSSQIRHILTIGKKFVKQQYLLQMSSKYGELRPTNGWDQLASLGHPSKFHNMVNFSPPTLRYCTDIAQCRSTKLSTMFGRLLGWYTINKCSGALGPIKEFRQVQNSLRVKSCVLLYW